MTATPKGTRPRHSSMSRSVRSTQVPTSRWDAFETAGQERSTAEGYPALRLAMAAVLPMAAPSSGVSMDPLAPVTLVTGVGARALMRPLTVEGVGPAEPLDVDVLAERFLPVEDEDEDFESAAERTRFGGRIVVADEVTFEALVARCEAEGADHMRRALEASGSLPASSRVVVLTRALSRKYFLPVGLDPEDAGDWTEAFGLPGRRAVSSLPALYAAACKTHAGGDPGQVGGRAAITEAQLVAGSVYYSLAAQCSQFARVDSLTAAYAFMACVDPVGRVRSRLDGSVFEGVYLGGGNFLVEGSFTAKEGRDVLPLPKGEFPDLSYRSPSGRLVEVRSEAEGFVMSFGMNDAMEDVAVVGQKVSLTAAPYLFHSTSRPGPRWVAAPGTPGAATRVFRDVPLSVMLAGAPDRGAAAA